VLYKSTYLLPTHLWCNAFILAFSVHYIFLFFFFPSFFNFLYFQLLQLCKLFLIYTFPYFFAVSIFLAISILCILKCPCYSLGLMHLSITVIIMANYKRSVTFAESHIPVSTLTNLRESFIHWLSTFPDFRKVFYEGPSLPGAGHVSPSVRGGDMDITGRRPEDSGNLSYEMPATDLRYPLDRPHQQRDCLITYRSRVSWRANC